MPVVDAIALTPQGPSGPATPLGPGSNIRIVTNDFMFTGGDGYTALSGGTDVQQLPDELMLDALIEYIAAHSPVAPVKDGRRIGP